MPALRYSGQTEGVCMPVDPPASQPLEALFAGWRQLVDHMPPVHMEPAKLAAVQADFQEQITALMAMGPQATGISADRRFADASWAHNPLASHAAAAHLIQTRALTGLVDAVRADAKTVARLRFAVEQWAAASAPSNFLAFNAKAQKLAIETQGQSIAKGLQNLIHDLGQGHVSMTDESVFTVGQNVATTEGAVVFENELFQLLEYKPLTAQVFEKPFLIVPPCINKFYILDLQPENSLIRYAVAQGHRTFVVSWRNADESVAHKTWDDYMEDAVIRAIEVTRAIGSKSKGDGAINALGFCVGGTMLGTALAVLAARGEKPVASATFLTTLLDFSNTGVLDVFIDESFVDYREREMGQGGLMKGRDLATTFSFLRPNELVWNYVVGNYLQGESPPPFDLLYWNSDATNLPGPFYAWYLRNTYLENKLVEPGTAMVCGEPIDLGSIDIPVYLYASREDHIVPADGAYASTQVLGGPVRFVMGASGHIAGVINPPAKKKRSHWIRADGRLPATHAAWMEGATEHPGSWWTDWSNWLDSHGGKRIPAPKTYGKAGFKPLMPAPGTYVLAKA
ncbi:MAG: class I poly(R)-hydroxyalkanoic acid synthase [Betaproteobacteria bacterium]|nr:class I poly(R)-hydroxyalkanoic acid synthase [Betaproteobacteria bacterium]